MEIEQVPEKPELRNAIEVEVQNCATSWSRTKNEKFLNARGWLEGSEQPDLPEIIIIIDQIAPFSEHGTSSDSSLLVFINFKL